jgi:hypothetical protein
MLIARDARHTRVAIKLTIRRSAPGNCGPRRRWSADTAKWPVSPGRTALPRNRLGVVFPIRWAGTTPASLLAAMRRKRLGRLELVARMTPTSLWPCRSSEIRYSRRCFGLASTETRRKPNAAGPSNGTTKPRLRRPLPTGIGVHLHRSGAGAHPSRCLSLDPHSNSAW